jgi:HK97 family phage major capsid protein
LPYEKTDATDASWTQEVPAYDITADNAWEFGKRELSPIDLTKLIKISKRLLATSAVDIDTLAQKKISTKLSQAFEAGITTGSGDGQPLGVFTASNDGVPTSRDITTSRSRATRLVLT